MQHVVQTKELEPADRFGFWRETLGRVAMPVEISCRRPTDFVATVRYATVGSLESIRMWHPPINVSRDRQLIRRSDPEVYHLALTLAGGHRFAQDRQETVVGPGDLILYHSSRPFRTLAGDANHGESAAVVAIPSAQLPLPVDKVRRLFAVGLPSRDGLGRLVARHVVNVADGADAYHPADLRKLAVVTVDLVAILLARLLDTEARVPVESREQALFAEVQAFIDGHVTDPRLSPETIAAAHHISLRSLQRLFRSHATTVAGSIRDHRLERCRRDLINAAAPGRSVRAVALRWGFADYTTFSRAFKARYGVGPRDYQQRWTQPGSTAADHG